MFKKFFFIIIFFLQASVSIAAINNKIILTVADVPITLYDIKQEIKLLNILNAGQLQDESIEELQKIAVESLTIKTIKEVEVKKKLVNQNVSQEIIQHEISRLKESLNIDQTQLEKILSANELELDDLKRHIFTQILWSRLIYQINVDKMKVNEDFLNKKIKEYDKTKISNEYSLSEIVVPINDSQNINDVYRNIKEKILTEGFKNVASELSISKSAETGGKLGWINVAALAKEITQVLENMKIGEISKPIKIENALIIIQVNNKRRLEEKLDLEIIKKQIINNEQNRLLNLYSKTYFNKLKAAVIIEKK